MFRRAGLVLIKAVNALTEFKQLKFSSSCAYLKRIADPSDKLLFVQIRLDFKLVGFFYSSVSYQKMICLVFNHLDDEGARKKGKYFAFILHSFWYLIFT